MGSPSTYACIIVLPIAKGHFQFAPLHYGHVENYGMEPFTLVGLLVSGAGRWIRDSGNRRMRSQDF